MSGFNLKLRRVFMVATLIVHVPSRMKSPQRPSENKRNIPLSGIAQVVVCAKQMLHRNQMAGLPAFNIIGCKSSKTLREKRISWRIIGQRKSPLTLNILHCHLGTLRLDGSRVPSGHAVCTSSAILIGVILARVI